ncbi:hypothetical protein ACLBWA_33295, partial [Pseudomonas aeruginosa]
ASLEHFDAYRSILDFLCRRWWELDSAFLTGLPLDRPREFLAALEAREAPRAAYRRMTITRQGCRLD